MGVGYHDPPLTSIAGSECPSLSQGEGGGDMARVGRPKLSRAVRTSHRPVESGTAVGLEISQHPVPPAQADGSRY
jgi:hypothetical protein